MSVAVKTEDPVAKLEAQLAATRHKLSEVATMGAVITSIHEISAVLAVMMDVTIRLSDGQVGLIMLESDGDLQVAISWGVDGYFARSLQYRDGMDLPTWCYHHRQAVILDRPPTSVEAGVTVDSVLCLPIQTSQTCHGVALIVNKHSGESFTEDDKETLMMVSGFVAVAIENAALVKEKLERARVDQEMAIARQVQETILPQDIDNLPGAEIGVAYYPAREVGGDFYDVVRLNDSQFVVIIGDVSNKGVPAALVMSVAAGLIKSKLAGDPDTTMAGLASYLNDFLAKEIIKDREVFVTLFFCKFDLQQGLLNYCNAGHIPGLLWKDDTGTVCELAEGGAIVGQFPGMEFREGRKEIRSNDRLFLFTDGLTEAANADGGLFGRDRAVAALIDEVNLSPKEFCRQVRDSIHRFARGADEETMDDFTILQVKVS